MSANWPHRKDCVIAIQTNDLEYSGSGQQACERRLANEATPHPYPLPQGEGELYREILLPRAVLGRSSGLTSLGWRGADAAPWRLLQNTPPPEQVEKKAGSRRAQAGDFERIRCPKCAWRPKASDRWLCWNCGDPEFFFGGCGTSWNTFATKGRCPGCSHQWRWTVCLRCHNWSLHG